mmetsp:Transcript_692/g.1603  ORF Transcript_692/g.1603 Transcript_692/m.1603 type:complete len:418 (-) Transcript_692:248-1501(-)
MQLAGFGKEMAKLAQRTPRTTTLRDMFRIARVGGESRFEYARMLQEEIPVRLAHRVEQLSDLPYGLSDTEHIQQLCDRYADWAESLTEQAKVQSPSDDQAFTAFLCGMLGETAVARSMADTTTSKSYILAAIQEKAQLLKDSPEYTLAADTVLDEFFTTRIGMRVMMQQFVNGGGRFSGYSGIIRESMKASEVSIHAAGVVRVLCHRLYGRSPNIEVIDYENTPLSYIPSHLQYVIVELLKNAARATIENHSVPPKMDFHANPALQFAEPEWHAASKRLPPIRMTITHSEDECRITIEDQAGGIPSESQGKIWSYFTSSAETRADFGSQGNVQANTPSLYLAGYGMGLPLSRLYCRYFGGDLTLNSTAGQGTVATIRIRRFQSDCDEPLPMLPRADKGTQHRFFPGAGGSNPAWNQV